MNTYILSCCTTADMTKDFYLKRDVHYICFHYSLDGQMYRDDLGETMSLSDFYTEMENGADTKTSQVNVDEYIEFFTPFLEQGQDILHVCLSSGISGTYNSATIAADMLHEKYPNRKIYVIDSLCASTGQGFLVAHLADLRDKGQSIDELNEWALAHRLEVHHFVFTTELKYLIRGGRVSKTAGTVAGILGVCPNIMVNREGKLVSIGKSRSKKKALKDACQYMLDHAINGEQYNGKCFVSGAYCRDMVEELADAVEQKFPNLKGKVELFDIGTAIGSHTGPGTVALFFLGDERTIS